MVVGLGLAARSATIFQLASEDVEYSYENRVMEREWASVFGKRRLLGDVLEDREARYLLSPGD